MDEHKYLPDDAVNALGLTLTPFNTSIAFMFGLTYYRIPNILDEAYITNCDDSNEDEPDLTKRGLLKLIGWRRHPLKGKYVCTQLVSNELLMDFALMKVVFSEFSDRLENPAT